jgi:heme oxygenase
MLYKLVREATSDSHAASMQHPLMVAFMQGGISAGSFFDYLGQLKRVYEILDSWGQDLSIYDSRLKRTPIINETLQLSGHVVRRYPATDAYVDHLQNLIDTKDTVAVLAHHYTRFMGDLAAGPMIGFLSNNLGIPDEMLKFYEFSDLGDLIEYRLSYGAAIQQIVPHSDQDRFIFEILLAFKYSQNILDELSSYWQ